MKKIVWNFFAILGTVALAATACAQGHYHLQIGAENATQGAPLFFDDEAQLATNFNFISTLSFTNAGKYAGYFQPGGITTAVLPATANNGGPFPNAPAPGSRIFVQIVSISGPAGGEFGFWETNALRPTFTVSCGTTDGTNAYCASENDGSTGSDPYGHIHGRAFTATIPGLYVVGLRAFDGSTNGLNGGPIHAPSDIFYIQFQAGVMIASFDVNDSAATITFGATGGQNFSLEYATNLSPANWQSVGLGSIAGDDYLHSFVDNNATNATRFYRVVRMSAN
jgi:hypothetical protein